MSVFLILFTKFYFFSIFRTAELKRFSKSYECAIKSFVIVMAKMFMKKNNVTRAFMEDLYEKVSIEDFINE